MLIWLLLASNAILLGASVLLLIRSGRYKSSWQALDVLTDQYMREERSYERQIAALEAKIAKIRSLTE